jgi:hypothetical protein
VVELIAKAAPIYLIAFVIFALSYSAGYAAGSLKWVDYAAILESRVLRLARNLEYWIPGYGGLLKSYKEWHDRARNRHLINRDAWSMKALIFLNNWVVANLTMTIRSLFVLPVCLSVPEKFFQGAVSAQTPGSRETVILFLLEFGGYFLTTCATVTLVFWTALYRLFEFTGRGAAFVGGLELIGLAYIASALAMAVGSWIEADYVMSMFGKMGDNHDPLPDDAG